MNAVRNFAIFILFVSLTHSNTFGQLVSPQLEDVNISLLTCRSGDELYSTFGHTAIRIYDSKSDFDKVYNYGVFSFNTPNFYLKFMRGKLPYYVGSTQMEYFLREYNFEKRSILEQELILNNDQKKKIIEFLVENAKPENREYKYDFFFDNCATRVVDVFAEAVDFTYTTTVEEKTFRELLKENLQSLVWSDFGIDIVIGARADQVADRRGQMFLPEYVMKNIQSAKQNDSLYLAKAPYLVLDFENLDSNRKRKSTNWPMILTSLILILSLLFNLLKWNSAKYFNKSILLFSALFSLVLLFMWFGTDHLATRDNWNLLWLNPLLLVYSLTPLKIKKYLYYTIMIMIAVSAVNCVFTILPQFYNFAFLPLIITIGLALYFDYQKSDMKTKTASV